MRRTRLPRVDPLQDRLVPPFPPSFPKQRWWKNGPTSFIKFWPRRESVRVATWRRPLRLAE